MIDMFFLYRIILVMRHFHPTILLCIQVLGPMGGLEFLSLRWGWSSIESEGVGKGWGWRQRSIGPRLTTIRFSTIWWNYPLGDGEQSNSEGNKKEKKSWSYICNYRKKVKCSLKDRIIPCILPYSLPLPSQGVWNPCITYTEWSLLKMFFILLCFFFFFFTQWSAKGNFLPLLPWGQHGWI